MSQDPSGRYAKVLRAHVAEDGLVTGLYAVRNPEKLARLDAVTALTR